MQKILISGCLVGQNVRYDGNNKLINDSLLEKWRQEGRLVSTCPEVSGGLPIPRPPCQIVGEGGGTAVLAGKAKVFSNNGIDRTNEFLAGANIALRIAQQHDIKIAILKASSPSCGNNEIYDGSFSGSKIPGMGVTSALLSQHGVKVFNEDEVGEVEKYLSQLEME
jgi:uncharacterized protein YbbK (DUF523 family)